MGAALFRPQLDLPVITERIYDAGGIFALLEYVGSVRGFHIAGLT